MNQILSQSEKAGDFSSGCVNNFKRFVIDKGGLPVVMSIFQQILNDNIDCEESVKNRIIRFFKTVEDRITIDKKEEIPVISKTIDEIPIEIQNSKTNDKPIIPEQTLKKTNMEDALIKKLDISQQEILTILRKLDKNHSIIDSLTSTLNRKDSEISTIRSNILEKERHIEKFVVDLANKDKRIIELENDVLNLTERLRTSLQMDDISKNQELMTLKNDISEALKLDYADFLKSKENQYNHDLFEAYRSTLNRIFKLLKRFGINCE